MSDLIDISHIHICKYRSRARGTKKYNTNRIFCVCVCVCVAHRGKVCYFTKGGYLDVGGPRVASLVHVYFIWGAVGFLSIVSARDDDGYSASLSLVYLYIYTRPYRSVTYVYRLYSTLSVSARDVGYKQEFRLIVGRCKYLQQLKGDFLFLSIVDKDERIA